MKHRLAAALTAALLIGSVASAEVVGMTPDGRYIQHHLTDDTEEDIYFVTDLPEIEVEKEDYNGDGETDLAAIVSFGGDDIGYALFVHTADGLMPVLLDSGEDALYGFDWDADRGLVFSRRGDTFAVYRWDDTVLHRLRTGELSGQQLTVTDCETGEILSTAGLSGTSASEQTLEAQQLLAEGL